MSRLMLLLVLLWMAQASYGHEGYILKESEGEMTMGGETLIKVSPETGAQSLEVFTDEMAAGWSTWSHVHKDADEVFYILSGSGEATLGDETYHLEQGDLIFIPAGEKHKVGALDEPMGVIFIMDRPGLADDFRETHRRYQKTGEMPGLEETNSFTVPRGTTYLEE